MGSSLKSSAPSTATTTPVPPPSGYIPPKERLDSPNTTAATTCPTFTTTTTLPVTDPAENNNNTNLSAQELAFQKSRQRRGNRANRQKVVDVSTNNNSTSVTKQSLSPTNSDSGTQTVKQPDYKVMYERERKEKEKLEGELSDVTEMLNKTLSCITGKL